MSLIDVRWPWRKVIDQITKCRRIISTSLHGLIVAEAYGIPAVWLSDKIPHTKYQDYYLSTGREVLPANTLEEALKALPPPLPSFDLEPLIKAFPYISGSP